MKNLISKSNHIMIAPMLKKILPFMIVALSVGQAFAQDTITLRDGQSLQGQILYFDNVRTKILTDQGARLVPVSQMNSITSQNRVIESQLNNAIINAQNMMTDSSQSSFSGMTSPARNVATLPVKALSSTNATADSITGMEETADKFWGAEWSGNINLGADLKTGNSETNGLNADAALNAKWTKHRLGLLAEYNREEDDGDVNVDNRMAQLTHNYFFSDQWFIENTARYDQDDIANIDYRATLASGLGYQPFDNDDLSLKFVLGPGYQLEEFENGDSEDNLIINWAMDYSQKFYDDLFRLFHNHDLATPADDTEAWLFESKTGVRVPIRRGIVATGEIDFDWDNDPAPGTVEDDTTYAVKLGYEW